MVQTISFGNISTVGGKTVLSGTNSGIDTKGLVESLAASKRLPAVKLEETISKNKDKITALTSMKTLLNKLKTALDGLRNPTFGSSATNAFAARTPFLNMTGGGQVSDYMGVTTASGAPIGKYEIKINHIAAAEIRQSTAFADRTSSVVGATGTDEDGKFSAGTFQINGKNVTLAEGASLNDVAAAINSVSSQSGVAASIVKFSDTDYRLVMASKTTGLNNGINITDADNILPTTPLFTVTQPPLDAEIVFNNEVITRSSNKISDLVDNVTFSLYQGTAGEKITLDIDKDNAQIAQSVGNFVDVYNEIRVFEAKQKARDEDGALLATSVLSNDSTLSTVMNKLTSYITGQASISIPNLYSGSGSSAPLRLGDLGISLTDFEGDASNPDDILPVTSNILQIDPAKLAASLESYFEDTKSIFEFDFSASSANIGVYKRSNTVADAKLGIVIDESQPDGMKAKITSIDGKALASPLYLDYEIVDGKKIISGADNGPLADFKFTYSGNGNETLEKSNPVSTKNMTLTVDSANVDPDQRALITHIFGAELADPIKMKYTPTGSTASIEGLSGTTLAGFSLVYSGDGTDVIDMNLQQGLADKMFNSLSDMLDGLNGAESMIDTAIESLQKSNTDLETSVTKIDDQITTYRDRMLEKFSALEAAIGAANSLLALLGAQSDARNNG